MQKQINAINQCWASVTLKIETISMANKMQRKGRIVHHTCLSVYLVQQSLIEPLCVACFNCIETNSVSGDKMLYANARQECTAEYKYENGTTKVCTINYTRWQKERANGNNNNNKSPRLNGCFTRGLIMLPIFASIRCLLSGNVIYH